MKQVRANRMPNSDCKQSVDITECCCVYVMWISTRHPIAVFCLQNVLLAQQ